MGSMAVSKRPPQANKMKHWKQELAEAIKSPFELSQFLKIPLETYTQPILIPRPLAQKIKEKGPHSALWKQFVPHQDEHCPDGLEDPISDQAYARTNQLIHRYKNRVLWMPTTACPVQCRYCFRKNELHQNPWIRPDLEKSLAYIAANPDIEEVILTGGDPFILSSDKITQLTVSLKEIKSLRFLRIHTRVPTILPSRIDSELLNLLEDLTKRFAVTIVIHCNHLEEIEKEVSETLKKLRQLPVHLMSQSVLLKGVNDSPKALISLFKKLAYTGVQPYYLHHPDRVRGAMHFYLSIERGRQIYEATKNNLSGWMLPKYVVDLPGGKGKSLAYNPESFKFSGRLRGREGHLINYESIDIQ